MKLAKNGNIANWRGTHSYSHAGQVQSLTSTVNQISVTLISATSLLQCMMHNGVKVTFSPKQLIGQRIREGLYTNSLVNTDSFYPPVDLYWFFEISIRTEEKIQLQLKKKFS